MFVCDISIPLAVQLTANPANQTSKKIRISIPLAVQLTVIVSVNIPRRSDISIPLAVQLTVVAAAKGLGVYTHFNSTSGAINSTI